MSNHEYVGLRFYLFKCFKRFFPNNDTHLCDKVATLVGASHITPLVNVLEVILEAANNLH